LLICAGAELGIPDIYGETIVDRIEVQNFTTEERDLVNEVLQAKKLTKNGRKQLLEDIFLFQKKDAIQNKLSTQHLVKQNGIFRDIYTEYIQ
jgi:hypothetical protein